MISLFVYILKLLLSLFITTILVTDINSSQESDDKNIKFMFFASFFTLTLSSVCSSISNIDQTLIFYSATIVVVFLVINNLIKEFNNDEKLKVYLICLCSLLFGFGSFSIILIGFVASIVSYIILYNSTDFYKFFFSNSEDVDNKELDIIDNEKDIN